TRPCWSARETLRNWQPPCGACRIRRASASGFPLPRSPGCRSVSPGQLWPGRLLPNTTGPWQATLDSRPARLGRPMLTVDFGLLPIQPGERLLALGCGGGRHAFEAARRGARVVAVDTDRSELAQVTAVFAAMAEAGEIPDGGSGQAVTGDATCLPF